MTTSGKLHLIIGPVGAGKSTFARVLKERLGATFLDLDTCMVRLYGEDPRPDDNVIAWYLERRERVRSLLWQTALDVLATGTNVLLELGLVSVAERENYYEKANDEDLELEVHCVDAPREVRRKRVAQRNESKAEFTQIVPLEFFERASDAWQGPTEAERQRVAMVDV